jgi:hypothetical protein
MRRSAATTAASPVVAVPDLPVEAPRGHMKPGPYRALHDYLRKRFADNVVLTFEQIEDLIGVALPAEARTNEAWWSRTTVVAADPSSSDSWVLANRSARVNLPAQSVLFARLGSERA